MLINIKINNNKNKNKWKNKKESMFTVGVPNPWATD